MKLFALLAAWLALTLAPPLAHADSSAMTDACPAQFSGGDYQHSTAVTDDTTCEFAESVRFNYDEQPTRGVVTHIVAHSPKTGQNYDMRCTPGTVVNGNGDRVNAVRCTGGINAVVDLWSND
jgi:hypothetical protein